MQAAVWLMQTRGWLEDNGALIVAGLALMGTMATGYWGWKQKRTPTGEAQLDDERQYRMELRTEVKEQRVEIAELEKLNDTLTLQNKQLQRENEQLAEIRAKLELQNQTLIEQAAQRDKEIASLKEDVYRLNRQVSELERRRVDTGRAARKEDTTSTN
jgi:predicted RNase H-like nuclease (RuvC/YqgF family)